MRYTRTPGSDNSGGPGTWSSDIILKKSTKNKKDATSAEGPIRDAAVWTDIAVNLDSPSAAGQPPAVHGTKGAVYLGTVGKPDDNEVDTLWWFDGTSTWHKTGLRTNGVGAPVTAIVCHSDFPNQVWVGTTVGVWRGVRTDHGTDPPTWQWESRLNGLPEAVVEDLSIFKDGGLMLLRATIASRGVWELRLDGADVQELTYLRAHDDDLRYRSRAVERQRDSVTQRSWHGSPDVRPRRPATARTAPSTLPWTQGTPGIDAELLRRFQSALRASEEDPRVRPTGRWDTYFNEVLRSLGAPVMPSPPAPANTICIDTNFWNAYMTTEHATAEPWGTGSPQEADLYDFVGELREGSASETSCSMPRQRLKVDVVVQHRGLDQVDGANVRVTLLWWVDPEPRMLQSGTTRLPGFPVMFSGARPSTRF